MKPMRELPSPDGPVETEERKEAEQKLRFQQDKEEGLCFEEKEYDRREGGLRRLVPAGLLFFFCVQASIDERDPADGRWQLAAYFPAATSGAERQRSRASCQRFCDSNCWACAATSPR